jgi:hypothetical protein
MVGDAVAPDGHVPRPRRVRPGLSGRPADALEEHRRLLRGDHDLAETLARQLRRKTLALRALNVANFTSFDPPLK